jgi:LuxR family transcriptional regulator, quorum-sensing system regulator BjaR1
MIGAMILSAMRLKGDAARGAAGAEELVAGDAEASPCGGETLDLIEVLGRAPTTRNLLDEMSGMLRAFGVDYLCLTGIPHAHQRFEDVMLAVRVPPEWFKIYVDENYVAIDPSIRQFRRMSRPFVWKSAPFDPEKEPRAAEMVRRVADFGLDHGLCVPVFGPSGCEGGVWMGGERPDLSERGRPLLHMVGLYAFDRARALRQPPRAPARTRLTAREREILVWIATGKSDWEIGEILTLSHRTVAKHSQTILQKLVAANRTQAVAIALRENIIAP